MSDLKYNYNSIRSQKARIGAIFSKPLLTVLTVSIMIMLALGAVMLYFGVSLGWFVVCLAAMPTMAIAWHKGELYHLPIVDKPKSIDDVLSGTVLGRLSANPTPREVAVVVSSLPGGNFFATRFGISASFLQEISSKSNSDIQKLWQESWEIYEKTNSKNISAAILAVALVKIMPNHQALLSHLQLEFDDLISGIDWYNHLRQLIEYHRQPVRTGGIARDWSFGWTPLLNRFALNLSDQVGMNTSAFKLVAHEEQLQQLIGIFTKSGRQNAVLVGQPGSGKTEIISAFAARLMDASLKLPKNLRFRQIYMLDPAALLAAAPDRGGLENLIPRILNEAYRSKNVIICLDNAQLFFEDGVGSVDISNVLLPILNAGNLRIILTIDEQRYLQIAKKNPELVNALNRIVVSPAGKDDTVSIMQDESIMIEFQSNVVFMYQAFLEAFRLGERYVHDQAMPGKAIKLLETSANYSQNGLVSAESVRQAIEKTLDIKVGVATDVREKEKLLNLEELIHNRMVNQVRAVKVVSDALRRARAGVRNQNKPIGTFMFLGPTGVGKTELAKSLAQVYFGGENRIIRLDMNEFSQSNDVNRLIADGAENANSLTAMVMKQPFSVILLDEIEKAHPNVLSTLLQMLDEGVMRDIKNREVSFRDAIVITTSNAGADRIREYIDRGYDIEQFEDKFIDELIDSKQFLPEFLNRFDEIVMFRPLNKAELLQVLDLMIAGVNKTMALQKVSVTVTSEAKDYLVEAGYDPRLGARPMRRVVQRAVENTVAKQMLSGSIEPGSTITINLDQVSGIIAAKNEADAISGQTN
ncbi:ATP-dependent Clp protease ATP-binding subunit [Candidatus Saccharibacteria bacterium]|nr:ATP-dependent Clp protease ATP-binding subunit [Candidatus Saccharibacteria bacterium]